MSKRKAGELRRNIERVGFGKECPKCSGLMERRKWTKKPTKKVYYFREWDYCKVCKHVQHYDEFKSTAWQESEDTRSFFANI